MESWTLDQYSVKAMCIRLTLLLSVVHTVHSRVHFKGDEPFVWTKLGGLRGMYENYSGKRVAAFLGVPFAQPPTGDLRFEKPQPIKDWWNGYCPPSDSSVAKENCKSKIVNILKNNLVQQFPTCKDCIRDAKKLANSCMLKPNTRFPGFRGSEMWNPPKTSKISEDCLYLNMWVPEHPTGEVLVWIFGGGFFSGSPSLDLYNGKVLAANHDLIVVNINYRLGPFGFLYLGANSKVTGNMGLLDQQMALKWIYENIREFGGHRDKVTLFGDSAGSASVTAHLLASGSHPYFSKVICLSGSITNLRSTRTPETMEKVSLEFAKNMRCIKKKDSRSILECLRKRSASDILSAAGMAFRHESPMSPPFAPINEDNVFFNGKVFDHLEKKKFKKNISAIFGTVNNEGTFWLPYFLSGSGFVFNNSLPVEAKENQALINETQYNESMHAFMPYFNGPDETKKKLLSEYKNLFHFLNKTGRTRSYRENLRDGVARFVGDLFYTCNITSFVDIIASETTNSVYMYYFKMRSSANPWPKWMGVMHGYDIEYSFGQPFSNPSVYKAELLRTEQEFSRHIMNMLENFVKEGIPSKQWRKYTSSNRQVLILDESLTKTRTTQHVDLHEKQCSLIEKAIPMPGQPNINSDEREAHFQKQHF